MKKLTSYILLLTLVFMNLISITAQSRSETRTPNPYPTLSKYGFDLTELAKNGRLQTNPFLEDDAIKLSKVLAQGEFVSLF